jgi:hypothetical protein
MGRQTKHNRAAARAAVARAPTLLATVEAFAAPQRMALPTSG